MLVTLAMIAYKSFRVMSSVDSIDVLCMNALLTVLA